MLKVFKGKIIVFIFISLFLFQATSMASTLDNYKKEQLTFSSSFGYWRSAIYGAKTGDIITVETDFIGGDYAKIDICRGWTWYYYGQTMTSWNPDEPEYSGTISGTVKVDIVVPPETYDPLVLCIYTNAINRMRVYKYVPLDRSISISSPYSKIGDNTSLPIEVLTTDIAASDYIVAYEDGQKILDNIPSSTTIIKLPLTNQGVSTVQFKINNSSGNSVSDSNILSIDRHSILSNTLQMVKTIVSDNSVTILNDSNRYYDNNVKNSNLVNEIISSNKSVYLVGNIHPNSTVLLPLLEP